MRQRSHFRGLLIATVIAVCAACGGASGYGGTSFVIDRRDVLNGKTTVYALFHRSSRELPDVPSTVMATSTMCLGTPLQAPGTQPATPQTMVMPPPDAQVEMGARVDSVELQSPGLGRVLLQDTFASGVHVYSAESSADYGPGEPMRILSRNPSLDVTIRAPHRLRYLPPNCPPATCRIDPTRPLEIAWVPPPPPATRDEGMVVLVLLRTKARDNTINIAASCEVPAHTGRVGIAPQQLAGIETIDVSLRETTKLIVRQNGWLVVASASAGETKVSYAVGGAR